MRSSCRIALVVVFLLSTFAACERAPNSPLGPSSTPLASQTTDVKASRTAEFGALTQGLQGSAAHGNVSQSVNDWRTARDDDDDRDDDEDDDRGEDGDDDDDEDGDGDGDEDGDDDDDDDDEDGDDDDGDDEKDRGTEHDSGFPCALGPFGLADKSFASKTKKGDQILNCTGRVDPPAERILLEGFPCLLHYDNVITLDSSLVIRRSGKATLRCTYKAS
jgi:hypothetical protein